MNRTCPACGAPAAAFHAYCVKCGTALSTAGAPASSAQVRPFVASGPAPARRAAPQAAAPAASAPAARALSRSEPAPALTPMQAAILHPPARAPEAEAEFAPPILRLAARGADAVILIAFNRAFLFAGGFAAALAGLPVAGADGRVEPRFVLALLGAMALCDVAYLVGLTGMYGQTLGKRLFGLKVVGGDGVSAPGLGRAALRELAGKLLCALALGGGYLPILWDRRRRGWHDRLAGTTVRRAR